MIATISSYDFLRHMASGDVFAVAVDQQQQVVGSVGPIAADELTADPSDFAQNMIADDNDWLNGDEFRLVEAEEIARLRGGFYDAE